MLCIIVSRADSASVHIGEQLLDLESWEEFEDNSRPDGEGGKTVYETDGARLREFDRRHLDMVRPAEVFEDPTLVVFASRHAGETGPLLTAHHTGNVGAADHGGRANELARTCPNALDVVLDSLAAYAPEGYEVGIECTHHGPSDVGAPSMFVEVGSDVPQWDDPAAARAVARAILDLRGVAPDRTGEHDSQSGRPQHLVGVGGGHYAPRFERVLRETDWAVGHILAEWGLDALAEFDDETVRHVLQQAFEQSRADYALVDGDYPEIEAAIEALGYHTVSETWVRETDGVDPSFVDAVETELGTVEGGVRFGEHASAVTADDEWVLTSVSSEVIDEAFAIDRERTWTAVEEVALAFDTEEGGTRPEGALVLEDEDDHERLLERLLDVFRTRYDSVERHDDAVVLSEVAFDPGRAHDLGVPEGPAFGKLANGQSVEVDGETVRPADVRSEQTTRLRLE